MSLTVYTKKQCHYCTLAKSLLKDMGVSYVEKELDIDILTEDFKKQYPEIRTMPLITDGYGAIIGGYTQLQSYLQENTNG